MSQPSWIGQSLGGRYKIEEILGQGGMSTVYKATDANLKRVVAVKLIHPHLSNDQDFVRRFEEEATTVAQLRHPNIVQVFDFNHDGDIYYMVLEFIPGETLQARLRRLNISDRRLSIEESIKFGIHICEADGYAHKRGMIHRDIKPANIMLDIFGKAILMDFGVVKIMGGQQHTATGAVVGTAQYMSPEQIMGEPADERTDIYSIGVSLFEMVSGRPPFEADSAMTLMMMHLNDPLPDLHKLQPNISDDLVAVIEKALAKKRSDRYQSTAQMAADLKNVIVRQSGDLPAGQSTTEEAPSPQATFIEPPVDRLGPDLEAELQPERGTLLETPPEMSPPSRTQIENASAVAAESPSAGGITGGRPPGGQAPPGAYGGASGRPAQPSSLQLPWKRRLSLIVAGGIVVLIGVVCLIAGGILIYNRIYSGAGAPISASLPSPTMTAAALAAVNSPLPTATPTATATLAPPTQTLPPTDTPLPSLTPTPTVPPGILYVRINSITIDDQNRYVVAYETFEYTEKLPGMHVHFFFNTVKPEDAGNPGKGPWFLYGGPRPFTGYKVTDRPKAANQMCALVANPNHSIHLDSGNCVDLPVTP